MISKRKGFQNVSPAHHSCCFPFFMTHFFFLVMFYGLSFTYLLHLFTSLPVGQIQFPLKLSGGSCREQSPLGDTGLGEASQGPLPDPEDSCSMLWCVKHCPGFGDYQQHQASCHSPSCFPAYLVKRKDRNELRKTEITKRG